MEATERATDYVGGTTIRALMFELGNVVQQRTWWHENVITG